LPVGETLEPVVEIVAGEFPSERFGDLAVEVRELVQAPGDGRERVEGVGVSILRWTIEK
jgi:hypothetical protein